MLEWIKKKTKEYPNGMMLDQILTVRIMRKTMKEQMRRTTESYVYYKIQKHFQNVMLVGMASENSKNYTYKCVDGSRHNGIKSAKSKCAH